MKENESELRLQNRNTERIPQDAGRRKRSRRELPPLGYKLLFLFSSIYCFTNLTSSSFFRRLNTPAS